MKFKVAITAIILLSATLLISSCDKEKPNHRDIMMTAIDHYLFIQEKNNEANKDEIKILELNLDSYKGDDKNDFIEILKYMKSGKVAEVKQIYQSLGNEKEKK